MWNSWRKNIQHNYQKPQESPTATFFLPRLAANWQPAVCSHCRILSIKGWRCVPSHSSTMLEKNMSDRAAEIFVLISSSCWTFLHRQKQKPAMISIFIHWLDNPKVVFISADHFFIFLLRFYQFDFLFKLALAYETQYWMPSRGFRWSEVFTVPKQKLTF